MTTYRFLDESRDNIHCTKLPIYQRQFSKIVLFKYKQ